MLKPIINYEPLIRIAKAISMIRDPEESVILKTMHDPKSLKFKKPTPYESVPKSFTSEEITRARG